MQLDIEEIEQLLIGSSIHACGGGGPLDVARSLLEDCAIGPIECCEPDAIDGTAITVYGVGTSDATVPDEPGQVRKTVEQYMDETGTTPAAIYPSECGPLAVLDAIIAADHLDVPLLDCDAADGRCVPLVTMTPLAEIDGARSVVLTSGDQQTRVDGTLDEIEAATRTMDGLVFVAGQAHDTKTLSEHLMLGTMTAAVQTGQTGIDAEELGTGTIQDVTVHESDRILHATVSIEGIGQLELYNEYWSIETDAEMIGPPAKIMLTDPGTGHGVPSGALEEGKAVSVFTQAATGYWDTLEGRDVLDQV